MMAPWEAASAKSRAGGPSRGAPHLARASPPVMSARTGGDGAAASPPPLPEMAPAGDPRAAPSPVSDTSQSMAAPSASPSWVSSPVLSICGTLWEISLHKFPRPMPERCRCAGD